MFLIQFLDPAGERRVGIVDGAAVRPLDGCARVADLVAEALETGRTLAALASARASDDVQDYASIRDAGRLLAPIDHESPARLLATGTGLTHDGSASARDQMHHETHGAGGERSDSIKMYEAGLRGGKPAPGAVGAQPEWFYKGTGREMVAPGQPLVAPAHAVSFAEEPEIVGVYVIDANGEPARIGFTLGNDYSDHELEERNYLFLAVSKLMPYSIGAALFVGELPARVEGMSRIVRGGQVIWERPFLSGEAHMCHAIGNLEHYHFRNAHHRVPGDIHLHFFGCPVMSYADRIAVKDGDLFEIDVPCMGPPLANPVRKAASAGDRAIQIRQL